MVTLIMASSPCRTASSQDSQKDASAVASASSNNPRIPDSMPGTPARWFFSTKQLQEENPSLKSGIDLEKELYYRQQAASFIHELGSKLQLSHLVMNVAMVYMHRFYVFHSFRRFPRNDVAAACVFLAAKVEEMPRKLEYIVKVSHALQHREEQALDVKSNRYNEEAQKIITYENILLQTLGFDLTVAVPNQFVVKCIHMLKAPKELAQAAYHFTNDCLHLTTLCLRYRPAVVACASIFLACSWAKWEIPTSHEGKPWYYYVDKDVTKEVLEALAEEMVNVYQKCPERLKIKRYLAVKREEGAGGASTSDGGGAEELQESALYNSITASIAAAGRPQAAAAALVKSDGESSTAQKLDAIGATEVPAPSKSNPSANTESSTSHTNPDKKPKSETAKVDLKSYMDRMKERRPDQQTRSTADSPSTATRKSFMPDVSMTSKETEDSRRQESRAGDRHGRYRSNHPEPESRSHSQRPPSGNSGAYRHDQRPASGYDQRPANASKPDNGRQYSDSTGVDGSGSGRKRHGDVDNDVDNRDRKMPRMDHDNGGDHGSSRYVKESSRSGYPHGGDSKSAANPAVSVIPKNSHGSGPVMNGVAWEDGRERPSRRPDGEERSSQKYPPSAQRRPDDRQSGRPANDVGVDDDMLRQAAQKADQLMKLQKLEKLKSMNMKTATSATSGGGRDKGSISKHDIDTPPLPPGQPPLPPGQPPPPPPPAFS